MTNLVEPGIYAFVAAILFWAAATDLKERRIPNIQPLTVCALFGLLAFWQWGNGVSAMTAFVYPFITGILIFGLCLVLYAIGHMGGGDVKLIGAVALVAGPSLSLSFVLFVTIAGGFVALGSLVHAYVNSASPTISQVKVPYGVAIMAGGVWVCLQKIWLS